MKLNKSTLYFLGALYCICAMQNGVARNQWKYGASNIPPTQQEINFVTDLQKSIRGDNQVWIANHIFYPIKVTLDGQIREIKNRAEFMRHYREIVTCQVRNAILNENPGKLTNSSAGLMLGHGEIWIMSLSRSPHDHFKTYITAINNS